MSRIRILTLTSGLLAAALTAAVLVAPAQGASEQASKKPIRPKVGQCRTTTFAQGLGDSDSRKPVPCSKVHRLKTFAVVSVPKRINLKKISDRQLGTFAFDACRLKLWRALGGTAAQHAQTPFIFWYFLPTKAEQKKGARWMRCDVSLYGTTAAGKGFLPPLPNLPFPMLKNRQITDNIRTCLSSPKDLRATPCNYPHVARSDQTFAMPGTKYPTSPKAVKDAAAAQCPGKRFSFAGKWEWDHGDHLVTCYSITTS